MVIEDETVHHLSWYDSSMIKHEAIVKFDSVYYEFPASNEDSGQDLAKIFNDMELERAESPVKVIVIE